MKVDATISFKIVTLWGLPNSAVDKLASRFNAQLASNLACPVTDRRARVQRLRRLIKQQLKRALFEAAVLLCDTRSG